MDPKRALALYIENVGHEPRNLPKEHPAYWQWTYKGTAEDKQRLLRSIEKGWVQPSLFP